MTAKIEREQSEALERAQELIDTCGAEPWFHVLVAMAKEKKREREQ